MSSSAGLGAGPEGEGDSSGAGRVAVGVGAGEPVGRGVDVPVGRAGTCWVTEGAVVACKAWEALQAERRKARGRYTRIFSKNLDLRAIMITFKTNYVCWKSGIRPEGHACFGFETAS
jgi:hypothetical protein